MMASCYNPLELLFLSTLLISAAILCSGDTVLDTDGNAVELRSDGADPQYLIQNAASGGRLAARRRSTCENDVIEAPKVRPGVAVEISNTSTLVQGPFVQSGIRYGFTFRMAAPRLCHTDWLIGDEVNTGKTSFQPIIAGDVFSSDRKSWFEIRRTEKKGVYKLAACSCEFCRIRCPEVGSYVINGTTVLGVGGNSYTVRLVKSVSLAMKVDEQ